MKRHRLNRVTTLLCSRAVLQCAALVGAQILWLDAAFGQEPMFPKCPISETYRISDDGTACVPNDLTKDPQTNGDFCKELQGAFTQAVDGKPSRCELPRQVPACPAMKGVSYSPKDKACVREIVVAKSDPADYVRDCLTPVATIPNQPPGASKLYVTGQSEDGSVLTVVSAEKNRFGFGCYPIKGDPKDIKLEDVIRSGAGRSGWVYGGLVVPFKFYPHSGELAGSATVGPYLGWRMDGPFRTATFVVSGGISTVTAMSKDDSGESKTVPLTAWSGAFGLIFEVSKGKTPFRAGLLVGKDWTDRKSTVRYENNARTWLALQLGFDFTDL